MQLPIQNQPLAAFSKEQRPVHIRKGYGRRFLQGTIKNVGKDIEKYSLIPALILSIIGLLTALLLGSNPLTSFLITAIPWAAITIGIVIRNAIRTIISTDKEQRQDIDTLLNEYSKQFPVVEKLSRIYGEGRILKGLCQNNVELKERIILDWWRTAKRKLEEYGDTCPDEFGQRDEELNDMPAARVHWIDNRLRKLDIFIGEQVQPPQLGSRKTTNKLQ